MELLRRKVMRYIEEHALFTPGCTLVVALSGGADSTALLDILAHLPGFGLHIVVAHLNHLLRAEESAADEQFARSVAARYSYSFILSRIDVAALAAEKGQSLEEAGREARYAFFREAATAHGATAVAVGHHKGDQAETVLMRLLRGSGGSGLAGMRPKSAGLIVRPLLSLCRSEIEAYLRQGGLAWREDGSNVDVRFLRNRIRHELLPYLENYNPDIAECLYQTAAALAADDDILETAVTGAFSRAVTVNESEAEAGIEALCREPVSLRKRLYRQIILSVKGDLRRISFTHLAAIDRLAFTVKPNSELNLPDGIRVIRSYGSLRFTRLQDESPPPGYELKINGPGLYSLPCGGSIRVEEGKASSVTGYADISSCLDVFSGPLPLPLTVRYFSNGDRFVPLGMSNRKKLKDLFIDRKIPLKSRKRIPLLVDRGEVVWVCGVQHSEKARPAVTESSLPLLLLTYTVAIGRY